MLAQTSVVIMASGYSKRMGRNKLFLQYRGQTFLTRTLQLIQQAHFLKTILVIKQEDVARQIFSTDITVIVNPISDYGQSTSVRLGAAAAIGQGCLFVPIDQPLLDIATLTKIVNCGNEHNIVFPSGDGSAGSPVYFGCDFFAELKQVTGQTGGRQVKQQHRSAWHPVVVDPQKIQDIDTAQQYQRLLKG
ncbi:NTP transferase domain-containing protein [Loigolactobacillus jiayinensis]|uniref:NTP transferase domain-containing protein n=1 Tax=Loigolactobacillus jiayinensis TaxID=2486016 RepID=A0ABW1RE56_9LACO|nr:NTP transferase domain-containing protein [Loigolactobacillus jiayinensis]